MQVISRICIGDCDGASLAAGFRSGFRLVNLAVTFAADGIATKLEKATSSESLKELMSGWALAFDVRVRSVDR